MKDSHGEGDHVFNRSDDIALLVGRLLMASLFLPSGFRKAMGFAGFSASLKGLPYPELWAFAAVAAELGGGLALVIGFLPRWTAAVLIAFTAVATWRAHRYWTFSGPARAPQEIQFFKNLAISGGLLFYFVSGPGNWSWRRGMGQ
jgi:putative oxidoreductase